MILLFKLILFINYNDFLLDYVNIDKARNIIKEKESRDEERDTTTDIVKENLNELSKTDVNDNNNSDQITENISSNIGSDGNVDLQS